MSKTMEVSNRGGTSAMGVLGVIFVLAKVFEIGPVAAWSWWWVLAPFWIGLAAVGAFMVLVLLFAFITALLGK